LGTTFLACALAHACCRHNFHVRYERISRLLDYIALAHADGGLNSIFMIGVLTIARNHGKIGEDAFPMDT
jgi:hypothetical protein